MMYRLHWTHTVHRVLFSEDDAQSTRCCTVYTVFRSNTSAIQSVCICICSLRSANISQTMQWQIYANSALSEFLDLSQYMMIECDISQSLAFASQIESPKSTAYTNIIEWMLKNCFYLIWYGTVILSRNSCWQMLPNWNTVDPHWFRLVLLLLEFQEFISVGKK